MDINLINNRLKIISDMQEELNKLRDMYKDTVENDPEYADLQEQVKKARGKAQEKMERVKSSASVQEIEISMKEMRDDIKDQKEMLAQELADYYRDTGNLTIKDEEGKDKRIIFSAKLVNP